MSFALVGSVLQVGAGVAKMIGGKKAQKKAEEAAEEAKQEMRQREREYKQLDMSNPYAQYENQMSENVYEDLTVNQQQAQFEAQQGAQQRANIMQNMQGAAGGSGIAGLAQAMANQGQLATQRASASIGTQEAANQKLKAQGELLVQQGEQAAMGKRIEGDIMSREWEKERTQTLLGMKQQETAAQQMAAQQAQAQATSAWGDIAGGIASGVQSFLPTPEKP